MKILVSYSYSDRSGKAGVGDACLLLGRPLDFESIPQIREEIARAEDHDKAGIVILNIVKLDN